MKSFHSLSYRYLSIVVFAASLFTLEKTAYARGAKCLSCAKPEPTTQDINLQKNKDKQAYPFQKIVVQRTSGDLLMQSSAPPPTINSTPSNENGKNEPTQYLILDNLAMDLTNILKTIVSNTNRLLPVEPVNSSVEENIATSVDSTSSSPQGSLGYLELRSTISSFQMDSSVAGIEIKLSTKGSLTKIAAIAAAAPFLSEASVQNSLDFSVSRLGMDFQIWYTTDRESRLIAATSIDHTQVDVEDKITLEVEMISGNVHFKTSASMKKIFEKIMSKAMVQLLDNPKLNDIPWQASVTSVNMSENKITFNAGALDGIKLNDVFRIYAAPEINSTDIIYYLASIRTTYIDKKFSEAEIIHLESVARTPASTGSVSKDPAEEQEFIIRKNDVVLVENLQN